MSRKLNLTNAALLGRTADRAASLFGIDEGNSLRELNMTAITANPQQPRQHFDPDSLAMLAASIERHGLLQPICVREIQANHYQIIAGERRFRAFQSLGRTTIPAMVTRTDDPITLALIENIQRENLDGLELAQALAALLDEHNATHEQLASLIGKSQAYVSRTLRILELPQAIRDDYAANRHVPVSALMVVAEADSVADRLALWQLAKKGSSVRCLLDARTQARAAHSQQAGAQPLQPESDPPNDAGMPARILSAVKRDTRALRIWRDQGGVPAPAQISALQALRAEIDAMLSAAPADLQAVPTDNAH